jgi:peptidoglycan/LPS O-acetylase OafA/YrhL
LACALDICEDAPMNAVRLPRELQPHIRRRSASIDALRGLAIFFVLMNHVNMRLFLAKLSYFEAIAGRLRDALVWNGQNGVQIFFAISGFLITSTTLGRWGAPSSIRVRDFYLLRFARIAPLLLALLLTLSILHLMALPGFVVADGTGGLGRALFAALTFHINLLEARRGYLPPAWDILWSLSVEETFYLCFPLICRWFGRGKWLIVILVIVAALGPLARTVLAHGNEIWKEVSYLGGMDAIALGCLTALILPRLRLNSHGLLCLTAVGAGAMIFILGFSTDGDVLQRSGLDMSVLAVGTCGVIIGTADPRRGASSALRPLRWLGRRSYEVYLMHMFVVMGLWHVYVAAGTPAAGVAVLFIAVILLSGLTGELVARYFSEPMNRYLRTRWGHDGRKLGSAIADPPAVITP